MLDINFLENSWFFEEKTLKKWELLFDEQEINNNFYIIKSWKLNIEKYTTPLKDDTKILASLEKWDFLWEASFTNSKPKEVLVKSVENTKLIFIQAKNLDNFLEKYPTQTKNFLLEIIETINKRVNIWNKYITSIYEINKMVNNLQKINYLEIFKIFEKIKLIMWVKFLIYLEKNPVIENIFSYKYNSDFPLKMQNKVIDIKKYDLEKDFWINKKCYILENDINIWDDILWKIIIWKTKEFSENEKRLFLWIITSIAWVIKQKEIFDEIRNKNFMQEK